MTGKELLLHHLKKSADHETNLAAEHEELSKSHAADGEDHTNAVLAQRDRDKSGRHASVAQHHNDQARHLLEMHRHVSGIADAELFPSQSDAGDELRSSAGLHDLLKRAGLQD